MEYKNLTLRLTEAEHKALKTKAAQEGKSIKEMLLEALKEKYPDLLTEK